MFALFHRSLNANSRLMLLFECSPRECLSIIAATYEYPRRASTWMDELKEESIDSFFKSKVHSLSLSPSISISEYIKNRSTRIKVERNRREIDALSLVRCHTLSRQPPLATSDFDARTGGYDFARNAKSWYRRKKININ